jgi:hypothetical protein
LKVLSDNTTSQSKDLRSSGIEDAPQLNESLHEASNLNNADVACNADQGQFSSYECSAPRNDDSFMVLKTNYYFTQQI